MSSKLGCYLFPWSYHLNYPLAAKTNKYTQINNKQQHDVLSHSLSCCQALSISQSLNLSLSLRDRDRADTIITLYHHHTTTTTTTRNFLSTLELTYTQV